MDEKNRKNSLLRIVIVKKKKKIDFSKNPYPSYSMATYSIIKDKITVKI